MKKTLPKFIVGHNVAVNPDSLYLIHTQEPRFIADIIPITGDIIQINEIIDRYQIGARTNRLPSGEYFIVGVQMMIDNPNQDELPKLMSRTGDWLFNYMKNLPK